MPNLKKPQEQLISETSKRARSRFPRVALSSCVDLCREIHDRAQNKEIGRVLLFDSIGRKPESGRSRELLTNSNGQYGLIKGGYNALVLQLTDRGISVISGSPQEVLKAKLDAIFSNQITASLYDSLKNQVLPTDSRILEDRVAREYNLNNKDSKDLVSIFIDNMQYIGLLQTISGGKKLVLPIDQITNNSDSADTNQNSEVDDRLVEPIREKSSEGSLTKRVDSSRNLTSQIHFNIQIHIPDNATPETYDDIFRSIAQHLLNKIDGDE